MRSFRIWCHSEQISLQRVSLVLRIMCRLPNKLVPCAIYTRHCAQHFAAHELVLQCLLDMLTGSGFTLSGNSADRNTRTVIFTLRYQICTNPKY